MDPTPRMPKRPIAPPPGVSLPKGLCALFGNNLREARVKAGLSQKDLTAATWITTAYIDQVEAGIANASLEVVERLASAVGKAAHDLLKPPRGRSPRR
jgi:transcriptional regulator with XRE-family HTH domain